MWGIESGSNRVLRLMNKVPNVEYQAKMLKIAKNVGMKNLIYLILRYPYEAPRDLEKTALFIKNNAKFLDTIRIYWLIIYRNSILFKNADALKIRLKECLGSPFWYDYEETDGNTSKKYRKALEKLRKKIIRYNNRYIMFKSAGFPNNIMMKYFGIDLQRSRMLSVIRGCSFMKDWCIFPRDFLKKFIIKINREIKTKV